MTELHGRLTGKVAVITGGAGEIGRATAKRFLDEGCAVLLTDRDEQALSKVLAALPAERAEAIVADVTKAGDNQRIVQRAQDRFGGIDIFVANAGIEGDVAPVVDYPEATFERVMAVNVTGPFLGLKAAIPALTSRGGGSIIITSSVAGLGGTAGVSAYVTSKHAVIGLMKCAAKECAEAGIRVNTINPAPVDTRMMRSLEAGLSVDAPEEAKEMIEATIPMGRYAHPDEVASVMLFLASDDSGFVTGSVYRVDGGNMS